jgi:hypothetical protein
MLPTSSVSKNSAEAQSTLVWVTYKHDRKGVVRQTFRLICCAGYAEGSDLDFGNVLLLWHEGCTGLTVSALPFDITGSLTSSCVLAAGDANAVHRVPCGGTVPELRQRAAVQAVPPGRPSLLCGTGAVTNIRHALPVCMHLQMCASVFEDRLQ